MSSVGLLSVGAVLFINGLMLLGKIPGKSAAVLNFFVGAMQIVFPTIILIQADGDPAVILGASGLYLFGFTYLYVARNQVFGLSGEGLDWFSHFVAVLFSFAWFGKEFPERFYRVVHHLRRISGRNNPRIVATD